MNCYCLRLREQARMATAGYTRKERGSGERAAEQCPPKARLMKWWTCAALRKEKETGQVAHRPFHGHARLPNNPNNSHLPVRVQTFEWYCRTDVLV